MVIEILVPAAMDGAVQGVPGIALLLLIVGKATPSLRVKLRANAL
jgi:hypothetical protein